MEEGIKGMRDKIGIFFRLLSFIQWLISIIFTSITVTVVVIVMPLTDLFVIVLLAITIFVCTIICLMLLANILVCKKQELSLMEQRRKDKMMPITKPLKKELENFLSYWKENKELIFEEVPYARKMPWMEIERVGKESKIIIGDNKNILSGSTENEITEIIDALIDLSKLIRMNTSFGPSDEYYVERKERAFGEGDEIAKKIEAFFEKM